MAESHTIRLRGPWELTPLVSETPQREQIPGGEPLGFAVRPVTQHLPAAWEAVCPGFRGTVRYARRFGKPTNLEAHERVWLVVTDVAGSAAIFLNGEKLPAPLFDVTDRLRERNLLQIDVTQNDLEQLAGLVGEVRLEIRGGSEPAGQ